MLRSLTRMLLVLGLMLVANLPAQSADDDKQKLFEQQVLPILKANCFKCHGGEPRVKGEFRITSREGILKGGELGSVVDLQKPDESLLLKAINYGDIKMPPTGKLSPEKIAVLTKWVQSGLPWSATTDYGVKPAEEGHVGNEGSKYWAYQPIRRPEVPQVRSSNWVKNPVDAFVMQKLEAAKLKPSSPADKVALLRRVTYDLTGLPPTLAEVDAFLKDPSPQAYERVIDRLLDSPQYGEKHGRMWLDLVRYAETHGYERDSVKPNAWRYRDYVINSFNQDKPYDRFLIEQLAGDELEEVTAESLTATGYYRLGIWDDEPADPLQARYDGLDDIVKTTSEVLLGMTMGCARCHDHKGDPLKQTEYYSMLAYFHDVTHMNRENIRRFVTDADRVAQERLLRERQTEDGKLYSEIYAIEQKLRLALKAKHGVQAGLGTSDLTDVSFKFYRNTWDALPDFNSLRAESEGVIADNFFSLKPASRSEAIGLVFEGKLKVPADGEYSFEIDSTDGARLFVAGQKVVDRPSKGAAKASGKVTLSAGLIPVRLEYFNTVSKPKLSVSWSGPQVENRSLSDDGIRGDGTVLVADSRKQGQVWKYTTTKPSDDWMQPDYSETSWDEGIGGFGHRGTPGATVRTSWNDDNIWLRKSFEINGNLPPVISLDIHYDEDCEVFFNGKLVFQAKGFLREYTRVGLPVSANSALQPGRNVIAVHCLQRGGGQYIDVGIVATAADVDLTTVMKTEGAQLLDKDLAARYAVLTKQLDDNRKSKLPEAGTPIMAVTEAGQATTHVLLRGNAHLKGPVVQPATPAALKIESPKLAAERTRQGTSGKRLAFARWLTNPSNPLTARVFMNRMWQQHFGRGIVPTANDFGQLGEQPTHPELLDWLASEFQSGHWKIKRMHKLLLLSNTYQQGNGSEFLAAKPTEGFADPQTVDPGNSLLWHFNPRRLMSEEVRDSILAVTGELNLKAGGPSVFVPIPREVLQGQSQPGAGWGKSAPEDEVRRSVYVHLKRSLLVPILEIHDQPDTDSSCPVRYVTTVPTQSLGMLNGEFTNEKAGKLAERLSREAANDLAAQVRLAIKLTTSRTATEAEVRDDVAFIKRLQADRKLSEADALRMYCLLVLNTNEFVYLD